MLNHQNPKTKLQFITRGFPLAYYFGSCIYVQDLLHYLQQLNFEIEVVLLNPPYNNKGILVIPSQWKNISVVAKDAITIFKLLIQNKSGLINNLKTLVTLFYYLLPKSVKSIISNIKKLLKKQVPENVKTNKKALVQVVEDILPTLEEIAFVEKQFLRFQPDVVIVNYPCLANVLDVIPDKATLKVILTHDIHHQRSASLRKVGIDLDRIDWSWELESTQLQKAQTLLAIQKEDAKVLKEMAPSSEVIYTPMSAASRTHTVKQVPGRCLFVGSRAPHNVHGLQWFLENVWSLIIESVPNSSLYICGNVCEQIQGIFPNVELLGEVDNLEPEYGAAEVCLIPLLAGSGLKIKLVEAMSYKRACVSTSVGVQGLAEIIGQTALVADTPLDFAAAVCALLTNKEKRHWMEEQAQKYISEKLSPQAAYQPFVEQVEQHLKQISKL